jgi:hypothetical protein
VSRARRPETGVGGIDAAMVNAAHAALERTEFIKSRRGAHRDCA